MHRETVFLHKPSFWNIIFHSEDCGHQNGRRSSKFAEKSRSGSPLTGVRKSFLGGILLDVLVLMDVYQRYALGKLCHTATRAVESGLWVATMFDHWKPGKYSFRCHCAPAGLFHKFLKLVPSAQVMFVVTYISGLMLMVGITYLALLSICLITPPCMDGFDYVLYCID